MVDKNENTLIRDKHRLSSHVYSKETSNKHLMLTLYLPPAFKTVNRKTLLMTNVCDNVSLVWKRL